MSPLKVVESHDMENPRYWLQVQPYAIGQYRIQLVANEPSHPYGGSILREMCTYRPEMAESVVNRLRESEEPEGSVRALERSWNCEKFGMARIRLDNTIESRPEWKKDPDARRQLQELGELDDELGVPAPGEKELTWAGGSF